MYPKRDGISDCSTIRVSATYLDRRRSGLRVWGEIPSVEAMSKRLETRAMRYVEATMT